MKSSGKIIGRASTFSPIADMDTDTDADANSNLLASFGTLVIETLKVTLIGLLGGQSASGEREQRGRRPSGASSGHQRARYLLAWGHSISPLQLACTRAALAPTPTRTRASSFGLRVCPLALVERTSCYRWAQCGRRLERIPAGEPFLGVASAGERFRGAEPRIGQRASVSFIMLVVKFASSYLLILRH